MKPVRAEISGLVWQLRVAEGDQVAADQELVVLESMKVEIPVVAPQAGTVSEIRVQPNDRVAEGDVLVILTTPG